MRIGVVVSWALGSMVLAAGCPKNGGDDGGTSAAVTTSSTAGPGTSNGSGTSNDSATSNGSATSAGSGSASATSTAGSADSGTSAGDCDPPTNDNPEWICCDGVWLDPRSDATHCGNCETVCQGDAPFCDQGTCAATPCGDDVVCTDQQTCCGAQCCDAGMICCTINGPIDAGPGCVPPTDAGTCPGGCSPLCRCAAPETPIATPSGDRPIAELRAGDLVYSLDHGTVVAVPIARVQRVPAQDHQVALVRLDDGRTLRVTPSHPLADGRAFGDVRAGERLGDATVVSARVVPYDEAFTYDILPQSSSGTYFVAGEAIASTMLDAVPSR